MQQGYWQSWRQASCMPDCWCEAPRMGSLIVEPANTFSNIAYFIAAAMVLMLIKKRESLPINQITHDKFYFRMFAFALVLVGAGSMFFHMSLTFWGQWVDVLGMYFVTIFYILFNYNRLHPMSNQKFLWLYLGINALLGIIIYFFPETRRWLFAGTIVLTLFSTIYVAKKTSYKIENKYFWLSLGSIVLAQVFWNIDRMKIICYPYSYFNGHVWWHLLGAVSGWYFFRYLLSEDRSTEVQQGTQVMAQV
jgi:hypothetical protein